MFNTPEVVSGGTNTMDAERDMKVQKLKYLTQMALDTVSSISDPVLKKSAFELTYKHLLEKEFGELKVDDSLSIVGLLKKDDDSNKGNDNQLTRLCKATGLRQEQIEGIFELDGEDFTLIGKVPGQYETQKQQNATLLILTFSNYVKSQKEIFTTDLNKKLTDIGIGSLVNLSTNLKKFENYIVKKGKTGSPNVSYRITTPGLICGVNLIKEMAGESSERN